jgi:hypothetical protein
VLVDDVELLEERETLELRAPQLQDVKHQRGESEVADCRRLQESVDPECQMVVWRELRLGDAPRAGLAVERFGVRFDLLRGGEDAAGGDLALVRFPREVVR